MKKLIETILLDIDLLDMSAGPTTVEMEQLVIALERIECRTKEIKARAEEWLDNQKVMA